ncbi:MAG: ABC transporter substrate-binding protein [Planctomycetes bacterium]|nr:ABC transporter substrate-binding protein [Planctomycetota bacterium]
MARASAMLLACALQLLQGAEVIDLAGRTVQVPEQVRRVSCIHSTPSHLLWRLAPAKQISIDTQFRDRLHTLPAAEAQRLLDLPLTGIYRGGIHREQMLALRPDLIISLSKDPALDQEQLDFATPVLAISKDSLGDYVASIRLLGRLLGNPGDGELLASYWEERMAAVAAIAGRIPDGRRPRVYYAQRVSTSTVGSQTIMASIIRQAGGRSFLDSMPGTVLQKESESVTVSLEDVLAWDPEVIIAASTAARDDILADPRWSSTAAVRSRRVHAVLRLAMLDRVQCLLGLLWTANILHPAHASFDMVAEGRRFYRMMSLNDGIAAEQMLEAQ